jgi:hypothetical protein
MIDWLLMNHRHFVRASRLILASCAAALVGIASLPRTQIDRMVAVVGVAIVAAIFLVWLGIVLTTIIRPRLFVEMRERRAKRGKP